MERTTLVYPRDWGRIWLAPKKRKVAVGKPNGWGGKKKRRDKNIKHTAVREFGEETDGFYPFPSMLKLVAILDFFRGGEHIFQCYVYFCRKDKEGLTRWNGELKETEEMGPGIPYHLWAIPYEQMMPADKEFLPRLLNGERLRGVIYYNADNTALEKPSVYKVVPRGKPLE